MKKLFIVVIVIIASLWGCDNPEKQRLIGSLEGQRAQLEVLLESMDEEFAELETQYALTLELLKDLQDQLDKLK